MRGTVCGRLLFLAVILAASPAAWGAPPEAPLKVSGATTLLVDPACNAWAGAALPLVLRNDGPAAVHLGLRIDPLVNETGGAVANARVGALPAEKQASLPDHLDAGAAVGFRVEVTGALAAGKWSALLYNGTGSPLATITIVVPEAPLRLRLATGDPNAPAVTVHRDRSFALLLENADAVGYDVDWDFRVGSTPATPVQETRIAAGGTAALVIQPRDEWFTEAGLGPFGSLFKDGVADAFLTVRLHSEACRSAGTPMKLLRLKASLAYRPDATKARGSYAVLLALLLAGALCSLYLNFRFPDQQIRGALNEQLKNIGAAIGSLSMRLASRLRVLVGVEQRLLRAQLKSLSWYSLEFESRRAQIADAADRLERRVSLLEGMGRLRDDYEEAAQLDVPPSILDRLEDRFERTVRLLNVMNPPSADLQDAEMMLAEIKKELSDWSQPDSALAGQVAARLKILNADIVQALPTSPTWKALQAGCASLVNRLAAAPAPDAAGVLSDLTRNDRLAFRGKLLWDYAVLCDRRAPITGTPLASRQKELIGDLLSDRWDDLRRARRLVKEMSESIYADDIRAEIENGRVEIETDRSLTRAFDPAEFYLSFQAKRFESATARDEWSCTWNFGHVAAGAPDRPVNYLEEEGWSVTHYFPKAGGPTVTVRFRHESGGDLIRAPAAPVAGHTSAPGSAVAPNVNAPAQRVTIALPVLLGDQNGEVSGRFAWLRKWAQWRRENGSALTRLAVALAPAVLALVAGARDQLLKMDLFPALGAVFLAGFGSDQVKNLLSQKKTGA